jgi:hypothetical protein
MQEIKIFRRQDGVVVHEEIKSWLIDDSPSSSQFWVLRAPGHGWAFAFIDSFQKSDYRYSMVCSDTRISPESQPTMASLLAQNHSGGKIILELSDLSDLANSLNWLVSTLMYRFDEQRDLVDYPIELQKATCLLIKLRKIMSQ